MGALLARSVLVSPGRNIEVRADCFEAPRGALTGLIGPNGAGKSSLLKAIAGVIPAKGSFTMEGVALPSPETRFRARMVGYLAQGHVLHWPMTVRQVVELGRLPWIHPWRKHGTADSKAVDYAMERAEVSDLANRNAATLSGGERARVMLARVLASETPIILADEPTANLDPAHQISVCGLLADLARRENRSVTIVLHDLCLAARFCDRIAVMDNCRLTVSGTPDITLAPSVIDAIYGIPFINVRIGTIPVVIADRAGASRKDDNSDTVLSRTS